MNNLRHYFSSTESFQSAQIGISVVDIEQKKEIYGRNQNQFFIPASLQKVPLAAAALFYLGKDFCFETSLAYEGKIDPEGILHGNVWITGHGDPSLSLDILHAWKNALLKEGIRQIKGKICVDVSCFERAAASPFWSFEDLGNYYGAGSFGLNIHKNLYAVTFRPGKKEGDLARVIKIEPQIPHLNVINEVTTGPPGSGDKVCIYGTEYFPTQYYRGTVPLDEPYFTVRGAIFNPPAFCGHQIAAEIPASGGVEIIQEKTFKKTIPVYVHHSPDLPSLIKEMNHHSVNLFAENLLKTIGRGSSLDGRILLQKYLHGKGAHCQVKDGSGLARCNFITPSGYTNFLLSLYNDPLYQPVLDSLPEPSQEGTLETFPVLKNGRLKAKTGTLGDCYNLGGFLTLHGNKEIAFAIFCNNFLGNHSDIKDETIAFLYKLAETLQ